MKPKIAFPLISSALFLAQAVGLETQVRADAGESLYSVYKVQDPFFPGFLLELTHSEQDTTLQTTRSEGAQLSYGFQNGVAVDFFLPILTADSPENAVGASVPRTGGQQQGKPEFDGYFRFWGNAENYMAIELGLAIPYESDPAVESTTADRLVIPASFLTRFGNHWASVRFTFTDIWALPAKTTSPKTGVSDYADQQEAFGFTLAIAGFPEGQFSPFIVWNENLAFNRNAESDQYPNAFIIAPGHTPEGRNFGLGVDWVPWATQPLIASAELSYKCLQVFDDQSPWSWVLRIRWGL